MTQKRKLQVFVSSTYKDLVAERQAAVEAILEAGHIPAGMELFAFGDESQMEVIKRWIDESDVFLLILGGRYGSIEPRTKKSYTQLEFEYAVETAKPHFSIAIKEEAIKRRVEALGIDVIEQEEPRKLKKFRTLVTRNNIQLWGDTKDIKLSVHQKLNIYHSRDDLVGWVRADQVTKPETADEIARLSVENADLRNQLMKSPESVFAPKFDIQFWISWESWDTKIKVDGKDAYITVSGYRLYAEVENTGNELAQTLQANIEIPQGILATDFREAHKTSRGNPYMLSINNDKRPSFLVGGGNTAVKFVLPGEIRSAFVPLLNEAVENRDDVELNYTIRAEKGYPNSGTMRFADVQIRNPKLDAD